MEIKAIIKEVLEEYIKLLDHLKETGVVASYKVKPNSNPPAFSVVFTSEFVMFIEKNHIPLETQPERVMEFVTAFLEYNAKNIFNIRNKTIH